MDNERLTNLTRLNNLSAKIHNKIIKDVYPEDSEGAGILRETLSIDPTDSSLMIIQKMLTFYLGCDKLSNEVEERVLVNKTIQDKNPERIIVEIKVKAAKRYKDGKQTGYSKFRIPNVNLEFLDKNPKYFESMSFLLGTHYALYTLKDGHQLKIPAQTMDEAHKICNYALQAVKPAMRYGTSEEHSKPSYPPKDAPKSPLDGEAVKVYKVLIVDPNTGKAIQAQRMY